MEQLEIINPADKGMPTIDEKYANRLFSALNRATSYPVRLNIGKHIINSATQDYIENTIRETGYYRVEKVFEGRYYILMVYYHYDIKKEIP